MCEEKKSLDQQSSDERIACVKTFIIDNEISGYLLDSMFFLLHVSFCDQPSYESDISTQGTLALIFSEEEVGLQIDVAVDQCQHQYK